MFSVQRGVYVSVVHQRSLKSTFFIGGNQSDPLYHYTIAVHNVARLILWWVKITDLSQNHALKSKLRKTKRRRENSHILLQHDSDDLITGMK